MSIFNFARFARLLFKMHAVRLPPSVPEIPNSLYSFFFFSLILYLFLAVLGLSYCAGAFVESGGYSAVAGQGFSLQWVLLFWSMASRAHGLEQLWLQASRAQAQQLWCSGSVAFGIFLSQGSNPRSLHWQVNS